jgi:hypothetical protein
MPLHTASISAFPSLANTRDNKMNSLYIVLYFWLMSNKQEVVSVTCFNVGVANGDIQFDNMEVLWKDAFMEASLQKQ